MAFGVFHVQIPPFCDGNWVPSLIRSWFLAHLCTKCCGSANVTGL